jgi:hypothetical protein
VYVLEEGVGDGGGELIHQTTDNVTYQGVDGMWTARLQAPDSHVDVNDAVIRHTVDDVTQRAEQSTFLRTVT